MIWKRIAYGDFAAAVLLAAVITWLGLRGGQMLGYNWQWYRVPRFFYRIVDSEVIWAPPVKGLIVTLQISVLGLILTTVIGLATALLWLSSSLAARFVARFARRVADTIVFMDQGEIAECASAADFFSQPRSDCAKLLSVRSCRIK